MSDYIPFEVQSEIIKRLPVKSVIECRSVSKLWKSLIDSTKFINDHNQIHQTQSQHHMFLKYKLGCDQKYISIIDNDTFPEKTFNLTVPLCVKLLSSGGSVLSYSNGLICFHGTVYEDLCFTIDMVALWNPAIKRSVGIVIPNDYSTIGFGVCPDTSDPKVVKINIIDLPNVHWEVEVYSLSSRVWKSVSKGPAFKSCGLLLYQVTVDRYIYWLAIDNNNLRDELETKFIIISYDLKSDKFGEVCFPDSLVHSNALRVAKVNESLGVIEYDYDDDYGGEVCIVWVMKDDVVTKSLTKMFTIKVPAGIAMLLCSNVLGLRENGEVMIEMLEDGGEECEIELYEPSSGLIYGTEINGNYDTFSARSYRESLLLLDHTSSIIYLGGVERLFERKHVRLATVHSVSNCASAENTGSHSSVSCMVPDDHTGTYARQRHMTEPDRCIKETDTPFYPSLGPLPRDQCINLRIKRGTPPSLTVPSLVIRKEPQVP